VSSTESYLYRRWTANPNIYHDNLCTFQSYILMPSRSVGESGQRERLCKSPCGLSQFVPLGAGVIEQESVRQSACFVDCIALALLTSRPGYGTARDSVPIMTGRLLRRVLSHRSRGDRIADSSLAASCYSVVVVSTVVNEKNSSNLAWPCLTSVVLCVPRNLTSVQRSSTACLPEIAMHMRKRRSTCSGAHPVCRAA